MAKSYKSAGKLGRNPMTRVPGLNEAVQKLNLKLTEVKGLTIQGMLEAAKHLRRETETKPPLTPVDTGNLRASWFVVSSLGEAIDEEGKSGRFVANRRTKAKAKDLKASHTASIASAKSDVDAHRPVGPMVVMGYSAPYALYVHEMQLSHPGVQWSRKGSGGKWFEAAFKRNTKRMIELITEKVKLK